MTSAPEHGASEDGPITVINIFEVPAEQVEEFMSGWRARAEIMATAPGFRDTKLHRAVSSQERFQLVNVAHWDSRAALETAQSSEAFQGHIRALYEEPRMQFTAYPGFYEVAVELGGR